MPAPVSRAPITGFPDAATALDTMTWPPASLNVAALAIEVGGEGGVGRGRVLGGVAGGGEGALGLGLGGEIAQEGAIARRLGGADPRQRQRQGERHAVSATPDDPQRTARLSFVHIAKA